MQVFALQKLVVAVSQLTVVESLFTATKCTEFNAV